METPDDPDLCDVDKTRRLARQWRMIHPGRVAWLLSELDTAKAEVESLRTQLADAEARARCVYCGEPRGAACWGCK